MPRALLGPSRAFCAGVVLEALQQPLLLLGPRCADRDLGEGVRTLPSVRAPPAWAEMAPSQRPALVVLPSQWTGD